MSEYTTKHTDIPPVLRRIDGKWYVQVIADNVTTLAPVCGWFVSEIMTQLVVPATVRKARLE